MKELKVGFLGAGGIAAQHIRALQKLPAIRVVGICNHNLARAEDLNSKVLNNTAACYSTFSEMLSKTPMDILYACLPPGAHHGEVESAAAKGIHLYLEKPIALDMARAQSIANAVHSSGVKCQLGFKMRHTEPARKLKAMLDDGSAGRPMMMHAHWFCSNVHSKWWQDPTLGGGHLIEQVIHLYDLARYFLGDVQITTGFLDNLGKTRFPDYKVDDTSASTLRFRNGAIASLCASNSADPWQPDIGITVICEKIVVKFTSPEEAQFLDHNGMVAEEAWKPGAPRKSEGVITLFNPIDEANRNFIAAIRENEPLRSSVADGVESLRLVLSVANSSANSGSPQKL